MIPVVVAGGVLLALSVLLSGKSAVPSSGTFAPIAQIGTTGLGLMVPVLSAYIAYSIADRGGLAPGLIGGMISVNVGAGFIGGILSGWLAGIVVYYLKKIKVSKSLKSIMPIFVIPLVSSLVIGLLMTVVVGQPIAAFMKFLTGWLNGMHTGNTVILGLILGAMIGSDMGGPINKVAFSFGAAMVGTINPATGLPSTSAMAIMGGIGVAISVPPLAMGLATLIAPKKFSAEERDSGKASLLMGMVGISQGAIPFAASDPLRVIPANIVGSAIGSAIAMTLHTGNPAPWGGWIVAFVAKNPFGYVFASIVGAVVTAGIVVALKKTYVEKIETEDDDDFDLDANLSILK